MRRVDRAVSRLLQAAAVIVLLSGLPSSATAQAAVSGPITFGTGLSVSNAGAVSIATSQSGLTCASCTLSGTTSLPGGGTISGSGDIGIGTSSPTQALDISNGALVVRGGRSVPPSSNGLVIDFGGLGGANTGAIQGFDYGSAIARNLKLESAGGELGLGAYVAASNNASAVTQFGLVDLSFGANSAGYAWEQSWNSNPLALNPLGNKVGIGTGSPGYQLDVQGGQINASGGFAANGTAGVSCAAGTVSLTTLTVTAGIVTHC